MAEADGSNDKSASFSAILKLVGGPLLSSRWRFWTVGDRITGNPEVMPQGWDSQTTLPRSRLRGDRSWSPGSPFLAGDRP